MEETIKRLEERIALLEQRHEETGVVLAKMFAVLVALRDGGTHKYSQLLTMLERDIIVPAPSAPAAPAAPADPAKESRPAQPEAETGTLFEGVAQRRKFQRIRTEKACLRWTQEDEKRMSQMYRAGLDYNAIGKELGRSYDAIKRHIYALRKRWEK